jgi:hypothetical protein
LVRQAAQCAEAKLGAAFSDDLGGKTMDGKSQTQRTGLTRGNLMRSKRRLSQSKLGLRSATRNRIVGGVILLIGLIVLLMLNVVVGVVIMLTGGWLFLWAHRQISQERCTIATMTDRVTKDSARLDDLMAHQSAAE